MSITAAFRQTCAVAAAAGALVAASLPAQGAVIVASFDPLVGPAMPGISYRGSASFTVNDACLQFDGFVSNSDACSNGSMFMNSAQVTFSDANGNDLNTLVFGAGTIVINTIDVLNGEVVGLGTDFANPPLLMETVNFFGTVALGFTLGDTADVLGGAWLLTQNRGDATPTVSNVATNITFTRQPDTVPEPGTLALFALAALGAGTAARRRKAA